MAAATIGEKIRETREGKGLTQKKLGSLCGISESTIRKYELGSRIPKIETLQKIANGLDVPLIALKADIDLLSDQIMNSLDLLFTVKKKAMAEEEKLLEYFRELNSDGREEALKQVCNLTKIKDYTYIEVQ